MTFENGERREVQSQSELGQKNHRGRGSPTCSVMVFT